MAKQKGKKPGPKGPTKFTEARRQEYLDRLKEVGEDGRVMARRAVGVTKATIVGYREKDPEFRELEEEALRIYRARIAEEIHRRGIDGVQEPIYHQGVVVGWVTRYSDKLLALHAKRHIKEYRDHYTVEQEHSGSINLLADLESLPADLRERLRGLLREAAARAKEGE